MARTSELSDRALSALRTATIDGTAVKLNCGQLDRPTYDEVNKALTRLGGKWKGGNTAAHIFPSDPTEKLAEVCGTGVQPTKRDGNPYDYFPTPGPVLDIMLAHCPLFGTDVQKRLLEPSAGTGNIALAMCNRMRIKPSEAVNMDLVEFDPAHIPTLLALGFPEVYHGDFLEVFLEPEYDVIMMNPPFTLVGDAIAYQTHIRHAYDLLAPGGILASIAPPSYTFREDRRSSDFCRFVHRYGNDFDLPADSFKASGTGVNTKLIILERDGK